MATTIARSTSGVWAASLLKWPLVRAVLCVIVSGVNIDSGRPPWSEKGFDNTFRAVYHIGNSNEIPQIPRGV